MGKAGNRKYLQDYTSTNNIDYKYTGDYYTFDTSIMKLRRIKIEYIMMTAVISAVYIAAGLLDIEANRIMYVMLPYAAMFLPTAFMAADVFKIAFGPVMMTRKQYDRSVLQLKHSSVLFLVLAIMTFAGDLIFIITRTGLNTGRELYFLGCCAVLILFASILISRHKRTVLTVKKEEAQESRREKSADLTF